MTTSADKNLIASAGWREERLLSDARLDDYNLMAAKLASPSTPCGWLDSPNRAVNRPGRRFDAERDD